MSVDNRPIGVFDSGIGGISVASLLARQMPGEDIIYLGDTARIPYGSKSNDELVLFARQILDYMKECGVKAVVAACNTSSSISLPVVEKEYDFPIIGVIKPGARAAANASPGGHIAVLATEATVRSSAYRREIESISPGARVEEIACPRLVPLVESGKTSGFEVESALREYLGLVSPEVDTLVLGCTHYPYLTGEINALTGGILHLVDPARETVRELQRTMSRLGIKGAEEGGKAAFLATGPAGSFAQVASGLWEGPWPEVRHLDLASRKR